MIDFLMSEVDTRLSTAPIAPTAGAPDWYAQPRAALPARDEITAALRLFHGDGPVELRRMKADGKVVSCIVPTTSAADGLLAIQPMSTFLWHGVNPGKDETVKGWDSNARSKENIESRRWIFHDFDRRKKSGTWATGEELSEVRKVCDEVLIFLAMTWRGTVPIVVASANGFQVFYLAADLPASDEIDTLISEYLHLLDAKYGTPEVKVDTAVADRNRVAAIPGTLSRKFGGDPRRVRMETDAKSWTSRPVTLEELRAAVCSLTGSKGEPEEKQAQMIAPATRTSSLIAGHTGPSWGDGKTAHQRVIERLERLGKTRKKNLWQCPAHDDHDPSLHVTKKPGRVLLQCFGKCTTDAILAALGLHPGDLFDDAQEEQAPPHGAAGRPEAPALPPREIVITCAADLQTREFKPLRFVVPTILPEGLTLFSGASKIGKTSLLSYIGTRLPLELPVFGNRVEKAGVLLLLLEDPLRRIQTRLAELLGVGPWPANLHVVDMFAGFPKIGQGAEEAITDILTKHPEIKLVGVDILNRVMPERRRGGSVYEGDVAAMKVLHEIANRQHVAMLVLHHDGKAAKLNTDFVDNASGSAGLVGTADNVWNIKRARGENIATLAITGREIEEQSLALRRDGHAWHLIGTGAAADVEITEGRAEILEVFDGEHLYPREILNRLCGDDQAARTRTERVFYRLVKAGAIVKDSRGRYYRAGGVF